MNHKFLTKGQISDASADEILTALHDLTTALQERMDERGTAINDALVAGRNNKDIRRQCQITNAMAPVLHKIEEALEKAPLILGEFE